MERPLPLVVLGGSDRTAARLPDGGRDKHALAGYKAVDVRIGGRPLVAEVLARVAASGAFGPCYVAGPRRVYSGAVEGATIIDTDSTFGGNIRAAVSAVSRAHAGSSIAFLTCDVLLAPAELRELARAHDASAPCDLWFPIVPVPEHLERLGASAWKPAYRIAPEPGARPVGVLPGHLVVTDPSALRLEFLYRLFDLGYRTRNRPIAARRDEMVRGILGGLLLQDLAALVRLRIPRLTWSVFRAAIPAAEMLRRGEITRRALEDALRKVFVRYRHRRRHPERRVHLPFVDMLPLARDIDTVEEARELGAQLAPEAGA